jgi:hypothetical protein
MQIDKENLGRLSDQDLFKALKLYNINAGPVTATTRTLYEKKLRNAIDKMAGALLDSTLNTTTTTTTNNTQLNSTSTNSNSSAGRTPTRQSSRKATNSTTVETIEPAFKTKEQDEGNGFEISISNGTQEPILKVSNQNASKIIIEKTTTTITTTPKQAVNSSSSSVLPDPLPTTTSTTTTTTSLADSYRSIRPSDSPNRQAPTVTTRNNNIFNNPEEFRSSSRLSDVLPPSSSTIVRPNPVFQPVRTSTITSSTLQPSPIQKRDKFAERLENYGLLRDEENVETIASRISSRNNPSIPSSTTIESSSSSSKVPLVSPTNIRSRQPLHSERSTSYGFTSYSAKPDSESVSQPGSQAIVEKNSGINWRLIGLVALVTTVAYLFIMYLQANPENPIA